MISPAKLVYFIKPVGMPGPIKIGCSGGPEKRVENLASWSPWPLEIMVAIPGDTKLERRIHEHFAQYHSHREWFNANPDILSAVERLKAGVPIEEAIDLSIKTGSIRTEAEKHKHPPENRRKTGYRMRLWWLCERRRRAGNPRHWEPRDIDEIMKKWRPDLGAIPSEAEIRRLDEVIADPDNHLIARPELRLISTQSIFPNLRATGK